MEEENEISDNSGSDESVEERWGVQPYLFQPQQRDHPRFLADLGPGSAREDGSASPIAENRDRLGNTEWCTCGNCTEIVTTTECKCCLECNEVLRVIDAEKCIIEHPSFDAVCLNRDTLQIAHTTYVTYRNLVRGYDDNEYFSFIITLNFK